MKTQLVALIVGVVLLLVALRYSYYSREGFVDAGLEDSGATFSLFYVDWCPHCKTVKPAFQDFAKNGFVSVNGKKVAVQAVECEKEAEKAAGKPVKGYPTILLEKKGGEFVEFSGDRTPEGYMAFLKKNI